MWSFVCYGLEKVPSFPGWCSHENDAFEACCPRLHLDIHYGQLPERYYSIWTMKLLFFELLRQLFMPHVIYKYNHFPLRPQVLEEAFEIH